MSDELQRDSARAIRELHIVIPAHNEEQLIGACLDAIDIAARHPELAGVTVRTMVVLDRCADRTESICMDRGIATTRISAQNVGRARAAGFAALLGQHEGATPGADVRQSPGEECAAAMWLSTTDADTRVAPDWLALQYHLARAGADAVFGVVDVDNWSRHGPSTQRLFAERYVGSGWNADSPHQHVHGANLGLSAKAYLRVGGIPDLAVGEDQALSDLLEADPNVRIVRTTQLRVITSGRRAARARGGFADLLTRLSDGPPEPVQTPAAAV